MYDPTKPYKTLIKQLIQQSWGTPYVSVSDGIYPTIVRKFSYPEVDHTDGIGTKGIYHWLKKSFRNAVLDALAMNLNDLAMIRATPYKLQNHILIPEDNEEAILKIVETIVKECKKRNIAVTGGETSIHNNLNGLEISMCVSGFVKNFTQNKLEPGDVLIGLRSSGLHANGFTKLREVFGKEYRPEFIEPTKIYSDYILGLVERLTIHGMMHITGGAYTKLKDLLYGADAKVYRNHKLEPQPIFKELYDRGITDEEMYRTFNCGIGFILSVPKQYADEIIGRDADIIGEVTPGTGKVKIESMFSGKMIEF